MYYLSLLVQVSRVKVSKVFRFLSLPSSVFDLDLLLTVTIFSKDWFDPS